MAISTHGKQGKSFDLKAKIHQVENAMQDEKYQPSMLAKIQKVPRHIRESEEAHQYSSPPAAALVRTKYFTPKMLSIGPIHHHLHLGEKYKLRWTAKYVEYRHMSTAELYGKIGESIQDLKHLFEKDVIKSYGDEELAWMLFVDGCSVLHFMKSCVHNPEELEIKYDQMVHMRRDLTLLENQLPYKVLLLLSLNEESFLQGIIGSYFERSLDLQPSEPRPGRRLHFLRIMENSDWGQGPSRAIEHEEQPRKTQPGHLLHFLRQIIIKCFPGLEVKQKTLENPDCEQGPSHAIKYKEQPRKTQPTHLLHSGCNVKQETMENPDCEGTSNYHAIELKKQPREPQPAHLLHILRQIIIERFVGCEVKQKTDENKMTVEPHRPTYKNIRDLKAARIGVMKAKERQGIYYSPGILFGNLVIPEFIVDDSTAITILNVIAYEMCPDFKNEYEVSSFMEFLESIIDDAEDVGELRKAGVLVNMLGSDQEVAQLFNCFSSVLVVSNKYTHVKKQIEFQYQLKLRTWIAQFVSDHFKGRWTLGAFHGVVLSLLFSGIQTYFSLTPRHILCSLKNSTDVSKLDF